MKNAYLICYENYKLPRRVISSEYRMHRFISKSACVVISVDNSTEICNFLFRNVEDKNVKFFVTRIPDKDFDSLNLGGSVEGWLNSKV